jgi:transcriptional regulator with XRE-family HTH domain
MEILQGNLLSNNKISIFMENLDYLLEQLNNKKQGEILSEIGISRSTYSRLKNNQQSPNSHTRRKICDFFGINEATNLSEEPLFLSLEPIGIYLQKQWLYERIDQISGIEFQRLFPALRRIFDEHYDS